MSFDEFEAKENEDWDSEATEYAEELDAASYT